MKRVAFLIDGFNLYHSVRRASTDLRGATTKWLNIRALCESYLYVIGGGAQLEKVYYFSALAKHLETRKPDVTKRHGAFLDCLRSTGIRVQLGRFKRKDVHCPNCKTSFDRHEEKETDVAIAVKLIELFHLDACDVAVLMTGDTDLAPALRTAKSLFPTKEVRFLFPYGRKNKELDALAPGSIAIKPDHYLKHQFADPFVLLDGKAIPKPAGW